MYYYFEQGEKTELLVITDHRSFHNELGSGFAQFAPWGNQPAPAGVDVLDRFKCKMTALPSQVRLTDYDYMNPTLDLTCSAPVASSSPGQIVLYGENYQTPDEGQRYAKVRAEEYLAQQAEFFGSGRAYDLRPGYRFQLEQHPRTSFNSSYLTTSAEHWGKQVSGVTELEQLLDIEGDDVHRVELQAIPSDVQFRTRRTTPWPRIDGVVDGVVDGSADSPYAQIDEHGRYKVRIFFDESDLLDGSASTWVRMLQPHGGGTEGIHFPLRKDTEVHILFLGGDPDRAVITGVAPNAHKPSKVTAGNHTQNVVMTGGSNRMELEDSDGSQYIDVSCPTQDTFIHLGSESAGKHDGGFDLVTSTLGRWKQYSLADRFLKVESFSEEEVAGYVKQTYDNTLTTVVTGAVTENYLDTHTWTVDQPVSWHFKNTFTETIDLAITQTHNDTVSQTIQGPVTIQIAKDVDETVDGATTYTTKEVDEVHDGHKNTTVTGEHSVDVAGPQTIASHTSQNITAPTQTMAAETLQQFTAETHAVDATALASTTAPAVTINGDGSVTISSGNITIEGGDVTITGGNLAIEHGPISVKGSAVTVDGGGGIDMAAGIIKLN
jgi:type VI secretion system secreted protein VgrG